MSGKVFDLVPLSRSLGECFVGETIESLHGAGNLLFAGGSHGGLVSYSVSEKVVGDKYEFHSEEWARQVLPTKQPITQIESASALDRLLVLSDSTLYFLKLEDLFILGSAKFKGITCFDINWNPSSDDAFVVQIAVGTRRRQVLLCEVSSEKVQTTKEVATEGIPEALGYDGACIFYATDNHYYIYNASTHTQQSLFPINSLQVKPIIRRIGKEEFLLTGMQGLGVFANGEGVSNRPPMLWGSDTVLSLTFLYPYVIAVTEQSITIHSVIDQELKQQLQFTNGWLVGNFDGQISVATRAQIFRLVPVSWEKQIEMLLSEKKVEEALEVAKSGMKTGFMKEDYSKVLRGIQQQAAFVEVEKRNWEEALTLMEDGHVDPREVISLYPGLMPECSDFTRHIPPLHSTPSIEHITKGQAEAVEQSWEFLLLFLQTVRTHSWAQPSLMEVNTAYLKVLAKSETGKLDEFLDEMPLVEVEDCLEYLEEHGHFYAVTTLLCSEQRHSEAISYWKRLEKGEIEDPVYSGVDLFLPKLTQISSDSGEIFDLGRWLYDKNRNNGMKVFLRTAHGSESDIEKVMEFLENFTVDLTLFLEEVVLKNNSQVEKFHTKLALAYMEVISSDSESGISWRENFRRFLLQSDIYRIRFILGKLQEDPLFTKETAFVHGKLGDHREALRLLVQKMRDLEVAEQYCAMFCEGKGRDASRLLYQTLFRVYVNTKEANDLPVSRILQLLSKPSVDLDVVEVLESLPDHWSFSVLSAFVLRSARRLRGRERSVCIGAELSRTAATLSALHLKKIQHTHWTITDSTRCAVCSDVFLDPEGHRFPTGSLVHRNCLRHQHSQI